MEEVGQAAQLRAGELIIIVVVLVMWAGRSSSLLSSAVTSERSWLTSTSEQHPSRPMLMRLKHFSASREQ